MLRKSWILQSVLTLHSNSFQPRFAVLNSSPDNCTFFEVLENRRALTANKGSLMLTL
jgi:hypothetical protein